MLIAEGFTSEIYLYKNFIYKQLRNKFPKDFLLLEYHNLKAIQGKDELIPKVYDCKYKSAIKMEYINGFCPNCYEVLNNQSKYVKDLVHVMRRIHKIDNVNVPNIKDWIYRSINRNPKDFFDKTLANKYADYVFSHSYKQSLCHMDLVPHNLIYQTDKIYIIDWWSANLCDPNFEYSNTFNFIYKWAFEYKHAEASKQMAFKFLFEIEKEPDFDRELFWRCGVLGLFRPFIWNKDIFNELNSIYLDYRDGNLQKNEQFIQHL